MRNPMLDREVVITGAGVVCAAASDLGSFWRKVRDGQTCATIRENVGWNLQPLSVCAVRTGVAEITGLKRTGRMDRCAKLSTAAAVQAWKSAGLDVGQMAPERTAVVAGTSRGPAEKLLETYAATTRRPLPSLAADSTAACLSGVLSARFGICGPAYTVSAACAAGAHAIALAADHVRSGTCSVALAGGADAPLVEPLVRQFLSTGILDTALPPELVCKPFDRASSGTILGEGAAYLVLESRKHAQNRGAKILGVLAGWALTSEGSTASAETGGARSLRLAAAQAMMAAGRSWEEIGYINVHGTGTVWNDALEVDWIREVNTHRSTPVPFGSTKPVTGHCLGATSAMEAVVSLLALQYNEAPVSANCKEPRSGTPDGLLWQGAAELRSRVTLSTSLGFWGSAAALVFSREKEGTV